MSDRSFRLNPSDIDQAFERNEFRIVFQPKVDLATQRVTGAEVFIRWQHPSYGLLPPGLFLDFVEAQGRMGELTGFVFHEALKAAKRWHSAGHQWTVSINVGPSDLVSEGFAEGLSELIQEHGLKPETVIVEVPERALAQEPEALCGALLAVREAGVQVALDGGGIVPVDLGQFSPMPFTSIKVGGTATIRLAERLGLKGAGAVAARLRFARQYSLEAVAVGVEDEAMVKGLEYVGFTAAQGIWIQRPLTIDELLAWDGTWAKGDVALDTAPVAPKYAKRPASQPEAKAEPAPAAAAAAAPAADAKAAKDKAVTRDDMMRALEAVRARRTNAPPHAPALKPGAGLRKQAEKPPLPAMDPTDLEDIVEDEEATAPRTGFGAAATGEACPPMKTLVERRKPKSADPAATAPTPRAARGP